MWGRVACLTPRVACRTALTQHSHAKLHSHSLTCRTAFAQHTHSNYSYRHKADTDTVTYVRDHGQVEDGSKTSLVYTRLLRSHNSRHTRLAVTTARGQTHCLVDTVLLLAKCLSNDELHMMIGQDVPVGVDLVDGVADGTGDGLTCTSISLI